MVLRQRRRPGLQCDQVEGVPLLSACAVTQNGVDDAPDIHPALDAKAIMERKYARNYRPQRVLIHHGCRITVLHQSTDGLGHVSLRVATRFAIWWSFTNR